MAIKSKNKDTFAQDLTPQESEVYETFRSMLDALCEGDTGRLSGIISDDARFADMKGRLVSKAEYLEDVADGSISYTKIRLKDVRIMIADPGNDASDEEDLDIIDLDSLAGEDDAATEQNAQIASVKKANDSSESSQMQSDGNTEMEAQSDEGSSLACGGPTATLTCTAHMKARLSGMSGSFKRHLIAFFHQEDGVWRYTGG